MYKIEDSELRELIRIAKLNPEVSDTLSMFETPYDRFINYVMPIDLFVSEEPTHIPEGETPSHRPPHLEDQKRYKIIFTTAEFGPFAPADRTEIPKWAINKSPILEIWIDRTTGQVEQLHDVPAEDLYDGMPVPIF